MARRRYVSTEISVDTRVNRLAQSHGDFAALLYTWIIPHADDQGALTADPEQLLFTVLPGRRDKTVEDVAAAVLGMLELGLLEADGDVLRYPADDLARMENKPVHPVREAWRAMARRVRPLIFARDGHRCLLCGATKPLHVDHERSIANGGMNDLENLRTLCGPCNWAKGAR